MEMTLLNLIFVFSFFFVSVALGLKWIGETIIQIVLARQGMSIVKEDLEEIRKAMEDNDENY